MTYYPPPQYGYYPQSDPLDELLKPARRAGILMFVLSGLMLLCGALIGAVAAIPMDKLDLPAETMAELSKLEEEAGVGLGVVFLLAGAMVATPAIVIFILAFFVRGGGAGSIVTSIVIVGLMAILIVIQLVGAAPAGPVAMIIPGLMTAVVVLLMVWLIQAIKNAGQIKDIRLGRQMQQWQAMQYQQMYHQPPQG